MMPTNMLTGMDALQHGYGKFYKKLTKITEQPVLSLNGHYITVDLGQSLEADEIAAIPRKGLLYIYVANNSMIASYDEKEIRDL